jgi:hypothetical protein
VSLQGNAPWSGSGGDRSRPASRSSRSRCWRQPSVQPEAGVCRRATLQTRAVLGRGMTSRRGRDGRSPLSSSRRARELRVERRAPWSSCHAGRNSTQSMRWPKRSCVRSSSPLRVSESGELLRLGVTSVGPERNGLVGDLGRTAGGNPLQHSVVGKGIPAGSWPRLIKDFMGGRYRMANCYPAAPSAVSTTPNSTEPRCCAPSSSRKLAQPAIHPPRVWKPRIRGCQILGTLTVLVYGAYRTRQCGRLVTARAL